MRQLCPRRRNNPKSFPERPLQRQERGRFSLVMVNLTPFPSAHLVLWHQNNSHLSSQHLVTQLEVREAFPFCLDCHKRRVMWWAAVAPLRTQRLLKATAHDNKRLQAEHCRASCSTSEHSTYYNDRPVYMVQSLYVHAASQVVHIWYYHVICETKYDLWLIEPLIKWFTLTVTYIIAVLIMSGPPLMLHNIGLTSSDLIRGEGCSRFLEG